MPFKSSMLHTGRISMQEEWKPVVGYEGLYEVSNLGVVKSLAKTKISLRKGVSVKSKVKEKLLKPDTQKKMPYQQVTLCKDKKYTATKIHRIVAKAFLPNMGNKPCVNHINNNPLDNRVGNLEWVSHKENSNHSVEQGRHCHGGAVNTTKLKEEEVFAIFSEYSKGGSSSRKLAKKYNLSKSTVLAILNGNSWKHLNLKEITDAKKIK